MERSLGASVLSNVQAAASASSLIGLPRSRRLLLESWIRVASRNDGPPRAPTLRIWFWRRGHAEWPEHGHGSAQWPSGRGTDRPAGHGGPQAGVSDASECGSLQGGKWVVVGYLPLRAFGQRSVPLTRSQQSVSRHGFPCCPFRPAHPLLHARGRLDSATPVGPGPGLDVETPERQPEGTEHTHSQPHTPPPLRLLVSVESFPAGRFCSRSARPYEQAGRHAAGRP